MGVEGASLTLSGEGFRVDPVEEVKVGPTIARVLAASSRELRVAVPTGLEGGETPVRLSRTPGESVSVNLGAPVATGVHQVDSPVFDASGNLYVTFSGTRGQEVPVAVYVVRSDGSREPFVTGIPNPTSMAFDAKGRLHVSSRLDGSVYRVADDGSAAPMATDLGVACGIAFDRNGVLHVGDRSGTILRIQDGSASALASLPSSVAAFHLAFGPDGMLFVTGPTLGTRDAVYRVTPDGAVSVFYEGFGRPQGLAFDSRGRLHVVDAIAGGGGLFRFEAGASSPEQLIAGGGLIGVAFGPGDAMAVASPETVYRFAQPA
jgi:sugar lactone lactonase YvrE